MGTIIGRVGAKWGRYKNSNDCYTINVPTEPYLGNIKNTKGSFLRFLLFGVEAKTVHSGLLFSWHSPWGVRTKPGQPLPWVLGFPWARDSAEEWMVLLCEEPSEPAETGSFSVLCSAVHRVRMALGACEYVTPGHLIPHIVELVALVNLLLFIPQQLFVIQSPKYS